MNTADVIDLWHHKARLQFVRLPDEEADLQSCLQRLANLTTWELRTLAKWFSPKAFGLSSLVGSCFHHVCPHWNRVFLRPTPLLPRRPLTRTPGTALADLPLPGDAPGTPVTDSPSLPSLTASSYRGTLPPPAPTPVSGPAPSVQVVNSDIFARTRMAAVPPPTSAFSAFHDGSFWCSKCPRRGFKVPRALWGTSRTTRARLSMRTPVVYSWRLSASPARLPHAAASDDLVRECAIGVDTQARPPAVGDSITVPLGAPTAAPLVWLAPRRVPMHPLPVHASNSPSCSHKWTSPRGSACCRPIPCSTSARSRPQRSAGKVSLTVVTISHCRKRGARSSASVPPVLGTAAAVAKSLTLWEESRFEDLLRRAEEQLLIHRKAGKRKKRDARPDPLASADRARRTAVGAYRKATTRLVSSLLSLEEKKDLTWPTKLLPTSTLERRPTAISRVRTGIGPSPDCTAPLSQAHGHSSGTRHGHAQRASTDSCQHASRGAVRLVSAGSLLARSTDGPHARGFAGSERKTANPWPIKMGEFLHRLCACTSRRLRHLPPH